MCKAIEDLINDSKAEGRLEGRREGRREGRNEGVTEGITRGKYEGAVETLIGLVRDNLISIKDASARLGISEDAFAAMLRK